MKKLSNLFMILAFLLSNVMCAVVGFNYGRILWGIENVAYSAPANVALLTAIPFAIGIIVCVILAIYFKKKTSL